MTETEHIIAVTEEEFTELVDAALKASKATSKMLRFGPTDGYPGTDRTNVSDVVREFNDIVGCFDRLLEKGVALPGLFDRAQIDAKKTRIDDWMEHARRLGRLSDNISLPSGSTIPASDTAVPANSAAATTPVDQFIWSQALRERDMYQEIAGRLARAIAEYLRIDIGEHTSANDPWQNALNAISASTKWAPSQLGVGAPETLPGQVQQPTVATLTETERFAIERVRLFSKAWRWQRDDQRVAVTQESPDTQIELAIKDIELVMSLIPPTDSTSES